MGQFLGACINLSSYQSDDINELYSVTIIVLIKQTSVVLIKEQLFTKRTVSFSSLIGVFACFIAIRHFL